MGKIYLNQSKLRLQLNTGVTIESGDVLYIKYKKPGSTTTNTFTAEELGTTNGAIYYDFQAGELDTIGLWTFWAYIVFDDGGVAAGEAVKLRVFNEGE